MFIKKEKGSRHCEMILESSRDISNMNRSITDSVDLLKDPNQFGAAAADDDYDDSYDHRVPLMPLEASITGGEEQGSPDQYLGRRFETIKYTVKNTGDDDILWAKPVIYQMADESNLLHFWIIKKTRIEIKESDENSPLVHCCKFDELQILKVYTDHPKYLLKLEFVYHTFYVLRQQTVSDEQITVALDTIHCCFEPYRCANLSCSTATICCFHDVPFNTRFTIDTNSVLGSGQFGVVYSATDLRTNEIKAIKVLKSRKPMEELKKEYFINAQLDCVNVIKIEEMGTDSVGTVMICMELAGIDYLDFILKVNGGKLKEDLAKFYTFQLLNGLLYLHQNDIIHRDIKPENLLLEPGVCELRLFGLMKIADFGMSNFITFGMRSTQCGSQQYQAPEIINGIKYDTRADIWAMGVVHYASIVGCYPFIQHEPRNYSHIEKKNAGLHLYSIDAAYFFREIFVDQRNRTRSHKLISSQYFRSRLETLYRSFSSLLSVQNNCYSNRERKGILLLMERLRR